MKRLRWGLIGGGAGSQIGPVHRIAAAVDGDFALVAGALDIDPEAGRRFAASIGIEPERAYGDWQSMLAKERERSDRIDLVTIATPNSTHFEISRAFLEAGFSVLCEKPMTMTVAEGEEIVRVADARDAVFAVNFAYCGYPLVREMRAMVQRGDLGAIRVVKAEFAHGHHADAADAENPRARWRYDPEKAGESAVLADAGIHALHMACFVTGSEIRSVSADFASCIASRQLEDDAMVNFRMANGTVGRLWASAIAVGRQHGLTLQLFGEKGGLRWAQEQPNQLYFTPVGGRTQIIERGDPDLSASAEAAGHVTIGHPEGMPLAFANVYRDLAAVIRKDDMSATALAGASDGLRSVAAVHAAVRSATASGQWEDATPPMFQ